MFKDLLLSFHKAVGLQSCFQVLREFKRPADVTEKEIDAAGDGMDHISMSLRNIFK